MPQTGFFCYHPSVPVAAFPNTVGLCKRCKRRLATLSSFCEPCFFAIVDDMDSDESELDHVADDDVPVIQLDKEEC